MRIALHDELASGIAVVAAPEVEQAHALGHAGYALWVFALPLLVAALIEAPIALLSDRFDRAKLLRASLWCWSASLVLVALAGEPWMLSLGLSCAGAASGVACTCAQAALVSAPGGSSARVMSRWTAFAAAGDLLAPPIVAAALWACGSYRAGALAAACLLAGEAWCSARGAPGQAAGPSPSLTEGAMEAGEAPREPFMRVFRRPRLWGLLVAASLCGLLDEVVVALSALHLRHEFAMGHDSRPRA